MATYEETFGKFIEIHHMLGALRHRSAMEEGPLADTSRGRGRVLALLKMRDGVSTRDMANVLGIRVSSLNETLARMEAQGYVERRQSSDDGRIMLVYLTSKGREAQQPSFDLPERLFKDFADDELSALNGYLDRMSATLEEDLGDDWRDQAQRMHERRQRIFHQAGGPNHRGPHGPHGKNGEDGGHGRHGHDHGGHGGYGHGGRGAHEGHGHERGRGEHGHGQNHGHDAHGGQDERPQDDCDHNCRSCTRPVCVRRG